MITPFPSEELAKLVLGYLAEEQLMTAYDEFLQASPHLDATRNEYDRIFMTSLKRIMAEYRAAMIFVQNCKPIVRDRLIKCKNILEILKFLVNHVDFNKLRKNDRVKSDSQNESYETNVCEVCKSLSLESCSCKDQEMGTETYKISHSTETTMLDSLPGLSKDNVANVIKKRHVKVMEKDANMSETNMFIGQNLEQQCPQASTNTNTNLSSRIPIFTDGNNKLDISKVPDIQKMEFNEFLNLINNKNTSVRWTINNNLQNISTGSFQELDSGVSGAANTNLQPMNSVLSKSISLPVPPASYGKNNNNAYKPTCVLLPKPADPKITILSDIKMEHSTTTGYLTPPVLKNVTSTPMSHTQTMFINGTPAYKDKSNVGLKYNYTKDEIMAMPTIIVVPGTAPQMTGSGQPQNTPVTTKISNLSAPLQPLTIDITSDDTDYENVQNKIVNKPVVNMKSVTNITHTIDSDASKVPNNIGISTAVVPNLTMVNRTGLIKPVEINSQKEFINAHTSNTLGAQNDVVTGTESIRISSLPKENIIDNSTKLSTPHVLPITRKSSSTPRRSSHIRVLDFTTPRRILGDTVDEHITSENCDNKVVNISSELSKPESVNKSINVSQKELNLNSDRIDTINYHDSIKENKCNNKILSTKKSSWDADLRSLIANNTMDSSLSKEVKSKHKPSKIKKSKQSPKEILDKDDKTRNQKSKNKRKTPKKTKKKIKSNEITETHMQISETVPITVKPNIKIISCNDHISNATREVEKDSTKLNSIGHIEEKPETPEMDRISLQSAIGSKLNISDFLETPFKQAIYDIQMETPRFLGPDLPTTDTPLSDIKIMNIPTPRFLESPNLSSKPTQATPSSYSSRPTDYSSGGSYYKPDDQDYIPSPEKFKCIIIASEKNDRPKITVNEALVDKNVNKKGKGKRGKSVRPVRRCTRNVSYYKSPGNRSNEEDNEPELQKSIASENPIVDKQLDYKAGSELVSEILKDTESTKNNVNIQKKTTPARRGRPKKDSQKPSSKIQSKKLTPRKRYIKDSSETPHSSLKSQSRRRISCKEKSCASPVIAPAPTKSRRKSSTPRKLHCSKSFSSGSTTDNSLDPLLKNNISKQDLATTSTVSCPQDSDVEQLPLRWSDDGSQEAKTQEVSECDDISKIKDYIQKEFIKPLENHSFDNTCTKTDFDTETAKIIEKDLLDSPHAKQNKSYLTEVELPEVILNVATTETLIDPNTITSSIDLPITQDEDEDSDDLEFVAYDCNEESKNYISMFYDYHNNKPKTEPVKVKDKFCMEACIDDGVVVRLRVNQFTILLELDSPDEQREDYSYRETEIAVSSISNFEKLYTPLKDSIKAQCYEIFDSTLTSLDTPLKRNRSCSPIRNEKSTSVTEIVLEIEPVNEEKLQTKNGEDKKEGKEREIKVKRKRLQSGPDEGDNKRVKTDAQYLLNSANIQNMDIESVLSKLHGP